MITDNVVVIHLGLSILMIAIMYLRGGFRDPLFIIALIYFYFAFGPIINLLLGQEIYFGTVQDRIPEATFVFVIAIFGMFLVSIMIPAKMNFANLRQNDITPYRLFALNFVLIVLILYQLGALTITIPNLVGESKTVQIDKLGVSLHYNFLLIEYFVIPFFFVKSTKFTRQLFYLNFGLYIVYCVLLQERDFIFLILSILIFRSLLKSDNSSRITRIAKVITVGVTLAVLGTAIFALRFGNDTNLFDIKGILNQGSLLFINTRIIDLTSTVQPFMHGDTYVNSIANLIPSFFFRTDFQLLSWFKNIYAPNGNSGYGFALDAEAYLNFGFWAVTPFFIFVSLIQRFTFNRIDRNPLYLYFSVFYTAFLPYAMRNDSLALFKGTVYAILFYKLIVFLSLPASRQYEITYNNRTTFQQNP